MSRPRSIMIIGIIGVIWGLGGTLAGLGGLLIILTTPDWFMNLLRREAEPELVRVFTQALGDPGVRR